MPDGAWWVELASLANGTLLPWAVASALDVRERPGEALTETLVGALKRRQTLLLLDNCEHLLAGCLALLNALLQGCPGLRVLATSREALRMLGETIYPISGLSLPPTTDLRSPATYLHSEAVRLFVDRAAAVAPSFHLTPENASAVARVCRQLDGIPLALEMAAARVRALPVENLVERIGDRFRLLTDGNRAALPRHRTLRAMIEWSYDLLSEPERALLRRLSVFASGWTLEAAEAVCTDAGGADSGSAALERQRELGSASRSSAALLLDAIEAGDVLDLLTALVDKSLVVYKDGGGQGRYRFLETIRQFAQERLAASGEVETTRQQHVECYLRLAETLEPHVRSPNPVPSLNRLEEEVDNVRAVLTWATEQLGSVSEGEAREVGLRLAAAVGTFWQVRGYATEGRAWLARLLPTAEGEAPARSVPAAVRSRAFFAAGSLAWWQGDGRASRVLCQESLCLARETEDPMEIARSLLGLGRAYGYLGEFEASRQRFEESLAIFRELDHQDVIARLCNNLGLITREQGDYERARSLLEESLRIRRGVGDRASAKHPLAVLGTLHMMQGDYPAAKAYLDESLAISRELGDQGHVGIVLDYQGVLARYQGDLATARARHTEGLGLHHTLGNRGELMRCLVSLGCLAVLMGETAAGNDEGANGIARGTRLFGAAEALRQATGSVIWSCDRRDYERCVTVARAALGEAAFAAAWAAGRALSLDLACELALANGD
jgi:non-specific serine/threonine protein kinase